MAESLSRFEIALVSTRMLALYCFLEGLEMITVAIPLLFFDRALNEQLLGYGGGQLLYFALALFLWFRAAKVARWIAHCDDKHEGEKGAESLTVAGISVLAIGVAGLFTIIRGIPFLSNYLAGLGHLRGVVESPLILRSSLFTAIAYFLFGSLLMLWAGSISQFLFRRR